jgi:lipopolysaccharide/colanic/teichoic acid biosynthesis glycosyltransferase
MIYDIAKKIIDITGATLLIIFFLPLLIFIPILIKLDSPGPVFADTPKRVGKDKKLFHLFKFRSMIANAHQMLREDPKFKKLYEQYKKNSYKLRGDPRITRVGHFLRRFSLDELPQVFNILKGEMSLVGPRAYYPDELEEQQKIYPETQKFVKEILKVRPGITGYWQVTGRSDVNFDKRVKMDAQYVRKKSILGDLLIIAKTPWVMVSGKGAL